PGIAVGVDALDFGPPAAVEAGQAPLQLRALADRAAIEAVDAIEPAVQIDQAPLPRAPVQAVDVLGNYPLQPSGPLELDQRFVGSVEPGFGHDRPAKKAARPVATAGRLAAHKVLVENRLALQPAPAAVAVGGNARMRGNTRGRQHQ